MIVDFNYTSTLTMDSEGITLTASAPEKHKCVYCGSVIYGKRCESCGAKMDAKENDDA